MSKAKVAVYFKNGIGNLLMMTPAMQALCRLYNSKIDVVMDSGWNDYRAKIIKEILSKYDFVNKIINFPEERFAVNSYKKLFTTAHCEPSQALNLFHQKGIDYSSADWLNKYYHEVEYYMNEVYKLGYTEEIPSIVVPAESTITLTEGLKIAIYNGAANLSQRYRWERKRWGKFSDLVKEIYRYCGASIVFLGGESEKEEGEKLSEKYKFVLNYAGKTSFIESTDLLSQCDLMISTDSSLMHTAEAVNVPVIALFGSTMVSKNRPFNGKYKIIRGKCAYAPCQYRTQFYTCRDYKCMDSITVGQVMKAVREFGVIQ